MLSGFMGIICAVQNKIILACVLLLLSGILDVLDGIVSRKYGHFSKFVFFEN
ncbi:MAG: CDP-alcohol phosphatidyltransferase family protein [Candidatus Phytoplasma australasiaticum]|nr:CDP-alcohol phosphatidyltransferase family protein [Candidatus Phytoplasma australasiaticum]